jgi:tRNA (guanine10-N2)-dimethyltransferase
MTHTVIEYLGETDATPAAFRNLLIDLAIVSNGSFAGRAKRIFTENSKSSCSQQEFERLIGAMIEGPVDLANPHTEFRAIVSGDRCYFGRVLYHLDRGGYDQRNPGKRPFFHPGVMMPRMARTLVNLSCVRDEGLLLDPFCGTGGLLIESSILGIRSIGSDFDPLMLRGSQKNTGDADLVRADASSLPFCDGSFDAVVTDFPYGQSVCILKTDTMDRLYDSALQEIRRVLRTGCRAVVVTHRDISDIARRHFTVLQQHEQRVHKSLTRRVLVLA